MRLASTSSSFSSILCRCQLCLILFSSSPSSSLLLHLFFFVGCADNVTCNMVITVERAPGPTWMLDVVAQPLNRLPGTYGKGSTAGQRHASLAPPIRRGRMCKRTHDARSAWIIVTFFSNSANCRVYDGQSDAKNRWAIRFVDEYRNVSIIEKWVMIADMFTRVPRLYR